MVIFTSICANYTHKARLLAESVKKNIPDAKFILCLTEREIDSRIWSDLFDDILLSKDIWETDFDSFIFKHAIVEASTAVKGRCMQYLIDKYKDEDKFIYLDPDCFVYSDFVELREKLETRPIVLCPHLLEPGNIDMELSSTAHGVFNLGFLGIKRSEEGIRFVNWWAERLNLYCYDDIQNGIFTDQKWVDLAPCFFDVEVFKHHGYDFSIWSLLNCDMKDDKGVTVSGDKLRFIHFSGQGAMAEKCINNWLPDGPHPFKKLYEEYSKLHAESDNDEISKTKWSYSCYYNGEKISDKARIAYRDNIGHFVGVNPFKMSDSEVLDYVAKVRGSISNGIVDVDILAEAFADFFSVFGSGRKVALYGAGTYGKVFLKICKKYNLPIESIFVSEQTIDEQMDGVSVVCIDDVAVDNWIVIPTLKYSNHKDVEIRLKEKDIPMKEFECSKYNVLYNAFKEL